MQTIKTNDVVLGYNLRSRIGSGGFGEVWSAEAPGGLMKAVKFVYGFHDDERAKNELKALDRIKTVRHPFLLSLERIQVVAGQLIIITELADKSLAQFFRETKESSGTAIPRDELLRYMRDAADALDYISRDHNLQHLDIKPENLLLVGGHIKIADFGLVKEVQSAVQSLMSGLTPIYAAPELFDGRPHHNSDQYSLAIVYQEMLTGTRPFNGNSPAQLASQHLHCRPELQALPARDQTVIARALSKDPGLRYPSCRDMIDELIERKPRVAVKTPPDSDNRSSKSPLTVAEMLPSEVTSTSAMFDAIKPDSTSTVLPALDLSNMPAHVSPTLIIGLGRSATNAVHRVRQRLVEHFGASSETPAIALLCIDTDASHLAKATQSHSPDALTDEDILPIPLQTSEQYRRGANGRWSWLSRRWIYNIPRSGQTEGLRPLGRLAFADHIGAISRKLKDIAAEITRPEVVAKTADAVGLDPCPDRVSVFIVAASSGGVGSGTAIDLAYVTRAIFQERGVTDISITGILAHAVPRSANEQLLAIANSLCLLNEIKHIDQFGYPGDETCGLPRYEDQNVFDDMYVVHLGDHLTAAAHADAFRNLGDYLFLNAATRCQSFGDQCRRQAPSEFRSFGLKTYGLSQRTAFQETSRKLIDALIERWVDEKQALARLSAEQQQEPVQAARQLTPDLVRQRVRQSAEEFLAHTRQNWQTDSSSAPQWLGTQSATGRLEQVTLRLREAFRAVGDDTEQGAHNWRKEMETQAYPVGLELHESLWNLVSDPRHRLGGAKWKTTSLVQTVQADIEALQAIVDGETAAQQEACKSLKSIAATLRKSSVNLEAWKKCCDQLFDAHRQQFECEMAIAFLSRVQTSLRETEYTLQQAFSSLTRWIEASSTCCSEETESVRQLTSFPMRQILESAGKLMPHLADQVDAQMHHGWLHDVGGLASVLRDANGAATHFPQRLRTACNTVMASAQREISLPELVASAQWDPSTLSQWFARQIEAAKPHLAKGPGALRLLIGHSGNGPTADCLKAEVAALKYEATMLEHAPGDLIFCQELQNIPFTHLVYRVMDGRTDALDLVPRLHSRTDIDWISVSSQCHKSE